MHALQTRTPSRIAYLQDHVDNDTEDRAGQTIHGVALAPDETNHGSVDGEPQGIVFPEAVLEEAAATLEEKPAIAVHTEDDDGAIEYPPPQEIVEGRVTKVAYEPGVGVLYEAVVADPDIARKIEAGVLDVSPEIAFDVDDPDADPLIATRAQFAALAFVSVGGSPSNTAQPGPNEAIASLSATGLSAILAQTSDESAESDADPGNDDDPNGGMGQSTPADPGTQTMSDTNDGTPGVDDLLNRLDEKNEQLATLQEAHDELEAQHTELEERNATLEEEIGEVKQAYAAVLSEEGPFDEDDLVENFNVATLRERFEDRFEDGFAATLNEPDVQSGGDPGGDNPGDGTSDEEAAERIEEINAKLSTVGSALPDERVATLQEEACELADVDDYDAALEVL